MKYRYQVQFAHTEGKFFFAISCMTSKISYLFIYGTCRCILKLYLYDHLNQKEKVLLVLLYPNRHINNVKIQSEQCE